MPRRFLLPTALLAFACLALPAAADPAAPLPRPSNLRPDILYTHKGEFIQVGPMRALTLNAHVEQFAYDPLGLEIAYVGSEPQGENTLHFVKTVDVHTGHEISRLTLTAPADSQQANFYLLGWSASGKYLLLKRYTPDADIPNTAVEEYLSWNLSADPPAIRVVSPKSALPPESMTENMDVNEAFASPDERRVGFRQEYHEMDPDGKPGLQKAAYFLYDPERNTFKTLALPPGVDVFSWSDNTHLKFHQGTERKQLDVITGQISPLTPPTDYAPHVVSKQYPDLSLDTQQQKLMDSRNSGGHTTAYVIWIRRTPFGAMPLDVAAAGLMPQPLVPDFPGSDDPKAVWSPTGKQIAFVTSGDLHVTDLVSASGALPQEKMAVGLKLSCADEQALSVSNMKQIGLAIIQNLQDNDEKYPAADGLIKTLTPYTKTTDIFQVDGHHFVYEFPGVSLASIESPAVTENGYIDLPCARVVLFCDGHVKVFAKEPTP